MDKMEKQAIITVLGRDRVGIIAAVSAELAKGDVNILDINQTILGDTFTMVMLVDYSAMKHRVQRHEGQSGQAQRAAGR